MGLHLLDNFTAIFATRFKLNGSGQNLLRQTMLKHNKKCFTLFCKAVKLSVKMCVYNLHETLNDAIFSRKTKEGEKKLFYDNEGCRLDCDMRVPKFKCLFHNCDYIFFHNCDYPLGLFGMKKNYEIWPSQSWLQT